MISLGVAKKYARAFLQIGQREGTFENLGRELEQMRALMEENKEVRSVLCGAVYPAPVRKAIAARLGEALAFSKTTGDFLNLLVERNRMDHFFEIVRSFQALSDEAANRIRAALVTPGEPDPGRAEEIRKELESRTGKQVVLALERDSSLIGGALARIGNVIYDGSLKAQLAKIRENLYKE